MNKLVDECIEGVLIEGGWDGNNRVSDLSLYTEKGESIIVTNPNRVEVPRPWNNKWVKVFGELCMEDSKLVLKAKSIQKDNIDLAEA